jgi:hypothetical protein
VKAGRSEGHKRGQYVISRKKRRWSCFHPPFLAPDSQRSCMKFGWSSEINRIDSMTNGVTRISLGVASISPAHLHLSSHPPQPHPQPPRSIPSIAFHSTQFTPRAKPPFDPVQVPPHAGSHHTHHTHTHTHRTTRRTTTFPLDHLSCLLLIFIPSTTLINRLQDGSESSLHEPLLLLCSYVASCVCEFGSFLVERRKEVGWRGRSEAGSRGAGGRQREILMIAHVGLRLTLLPLLGVGISPRLDKGQLPRRLCQRRAHLLRRVWRMPLRRVLHHQERRLQSVDPERPVSVAWDLFGRCRSYFLGSCCALMAGCVDVVSLRAGYGDYAGPLATFCQGPSFLVLLPCRALPTLLPPLPFSMYPPQNICPQPSP